MVSPTSNMRPLIKTEEFSSMRKAAETLGNKATNLKILEVMTQNISYLTVPTLHAVSHQTVSDFLEKHTKGKFQTKWKEFCEAMHEKQGFSLQARRILGEIETLVVSAFCQKDAHIPDIQTFLCKAPPNCRTIIRSTGREDTMKLANAGGNKTCINIPPKEADIAKAMGEVVASYFSARSIGQRLQAGDDVTREPFMPVLLQVMVGESEKGVISSSGVIFADESTGRTPGVSCIESALGHNELVVGGLGAVDRYFVGPNNRIHKVVAHKKDRLVSRENGKGLVRTDNPSDIRNAPALDSSTLLHLHNFYQQLKPLYGGHIDGEFTQLDPSKELVHLLQVRPLPQGKKLKPTYLNIPALVKGSQVVAADCRVRILETSDEMHYGRTVGEARRTFLALSTAKQALVKVIIVSTPGGSNSHEATEFRANNLPVLCLSKEERKLIKPHLENEQMLLLVDVVEGKVAVHDRLNEEALFKTNVIACGWSKHPLPAIQSITGDEGLNESELNAFLGELVQKACGLKLTGNKEACLSQLFSLKLASCSTSEIIEKIGSIDLKQRIIATVKILKIAYALCSKFKKTPLKERAIAVARQLIADAKDVWDAHKKESGKDQIQKLYALNWLSATLTQQPPGLIDADSPLTLLSRHKELVAAEQILKSGSASDLDMLSVMLRVGEYGLNKKVQSDWRFFCRDLYADGDKEMINQLARVLYQIASVDATAYWLHALFFPKWCESKNAPKCLKNLIVETARSIDALNKAGSLRAIAERFEKFKNRVALPETFDKYWSKVSEDLQILSGIPQLYLKQNSFGRLLLSNAVGEIVECLDSMIKEMLAGKEPEKVKRLQTMLRPFIGIMHNWLKLVDSKDVPGRDDVQEVNEQIDEIAERLLNSKLLQSAGAADQLNISARFNVSAAGVGSGVNFSRHKPENLADLYTLAHQNILFTLAYLQKKEDVFIKHLPTAIRKVAGALFSTEMLRLQVEEEKQCFVSSTPSLISVTINFPKVTMLYNAPQRNHSALFEIAATLNPQTGGIKELKVGARLFGYQAHDMPRMPWAAAYAELSARAGGFDFSPEGTPTYDRSRDMVEFTWMVDGSKVDKFAKHLPDYLALITTSLYTGSRSRRIPIPGGKKNFRFTSEWGMPKLDDNDNNTTLSEYYARNKAALAISSKLRLGEAILNIKRIHPEWDSSSLCPTDLKPISEWYKFVKIC